MSLWSGLLTRPAQAPIHARPSLTLFFCLSGAFALTLVPHAVQFPLWLTVTVGASIILRAIMEFYRLPLPSTKLSGFLAIVFLLLVLVQYGTVAGRDAGTALTAGLLAIKFYEIRRPRDIALVTFSCFFVVMSSLLYSQVLELFIYCLIMMWVLTTLLLQLHSGDTRKDRLLTILLTSGLIFLQAIPLTVFLFIFFPRYPGNLSFPMGDATIGLTDVVSPGTIAKISLDEREAMYVHFDTRNAPPVEAMYFRALVLWDYAGGVWSAGQLASGPNLGPAPTSSPTDVVQSFTVLAHNQKWLFALDVPISKPVNSDEQISNWAELYNGNVVQLINSRLNHTTRYTVTSTSMRPEEDLSPGQSRVSRALPSSTNDSIDPAVKALADKFHDGLSDTQEMAYVYKVLEYFHRGGFIYSTEPGIQGPDWLTDFLLKRKTGFCEHFASAFAILMRLEHIPARLIVGYQGGDYNPYSDKWVISQSNAHAWDEIWIPSDGLQPDKSERGKWMRIDPTALIGAVEPGQTTHAEDANDPLTQQVGHRPLTFFDKLLPDWARNAVREMQLRREQVESSWDDIVFSYDPEVQSRLASALGFGGETVFNLALFCLMAFGGAFFFFQKWMARKQPVSPVESLYEKFCRAMAQRGIPRASWEGPLAYTERVAEAFPDDKTTLEMVGSMVAHARYGREPVDPATPVKLKSMLQVLSASQAAATSQPRR